MKHVVDSREVAYPVYDDSHMRLFKQAKKTWARLNHSGIGLLSGRRMKRSSSDFCSASSLIQQFHPWPD